MRHRLLAVAVVAVAAAIAPSFAAAWHAGEVVVNGYRLPRDHRFESPDASGKYNVVNLADVPALIQQGRFVFDRTASVWIKNPNGTMNSQYLASASGSTTASPSSGEQWVVVDGYRLPRGHRFESPDASGKYNVVNLEEVPGLIQQGRFVFDRTANVWIKNPNGTMNPTYLAAGGAGSPSASLPSGDRWDRIRGTVQSLSGTTASVRTDDGRTVTVDTSQARVQTPDSLQVGDRVVVGGVVDASNRVRARYVRDEGRSAALPAEQGQWQRIHGRVQSVQGSTLRFRADDGRVLTVDMSAVGSEIQRALTQDEGATLIGFAGAGPNQFRAEYIQQDSSDASRR